MPIEDEACGVCLVLQPVEMLFEIGDPLFGVELHHFFKVVPFGSVHPANHRAAINERQPPICVSGPLL